MSLIFDRDELNLSTQGARYKQIAKIISQNISSGNLNPDDKIPTEPELMELFECSRITIRAAIKELVDKGQLIRRQGLGTFVTKELKNLSVNDFAGFTDSCIRDGHTPLTKVLSFGKMLVEDPEIAEFLGVGIHEPVNRVARLRYVDKEPIIFEISYVSEAYSKLMESDPAEWEKGLYALLKKTYGTAKLEGRRYYDCGAPTPDARNLLGIEGESDVLIVDDLHWDTSHKPIFYSRLYYKPNSFRLYSSFVSMI